MLMLIISLTQTSPQIFLISQTSPHDLFEFWAFGHLLLLFVSRSLRFISPSEKVVNKRTANIFLPKNNQKRWKKEQNDLFKSDDEMKNEILFADWEEKWVWSSYSSLFLSTRKKGSWCWHMVTLLGTHLNHHDDDDPPLSSFPPDYDYSLLLHTTTRHHFSLLHQKFFYKSEWDNSSTSAGVHFWNLSLHHHRFW